ncbi:hypothetical protein KKA39_03155 [Patescibacteria group bacterium]|nr:hypothetical protein [Patescibacteria group bacterium]MBU1728273.1 hypothetical protein [Patescibacteria group bacterium]
MPEKLGKKVNKQEEEDTSLSLFAELEEKTKHLAGAIKEEQKMRILEKKGYIIPQGERIRHYINYVWEIIEKEPEEKRHEKFIEILEKEGVFSKEELEILMIGEEIVEKGEIPKEEEQKIEKIIEKEKNPKNWAKKLLLLGLALLAPLYNKNKPSAEQEFIKKTNQLEVEAPQAKKITEETARFSAEKMAESIKIPEKLRKPIEFFKNLDFIKGEFYLLDKSDKKKPTLYQIAKEGNVLSRDVVGIGKEEGDKTEGFTTPAGIFMLSKWLKQEDIDLYGADGVLRMLGYSIDGKRIGNRGIHVIYPPEEKERTEKMLDTESSKGISFSCINMFPEDFKKLILDYKEAGGEGKLFLIIMQEKNDFDEKNWKKITEKMSADAKILEK